MIKRYKNMKSRSKVNWIWIFRTSFNYSRNQNHCPL